ncbi:MAG: aminodeoxychorismate/anthranilate synthase component II [Opitutaceae bacterium]|jgi:anthranilate synthase/aminodeoxychorismate synthase-like glutamine amidotransferase|nr:aminodeoxychorismate/anthranilate synthase component II [Opitutaceae bacterium]
MKLLMLDNFDSFTFNIVHYLQMLGADVITKRNDAITLDEIAALAPDGIVLSPGPGRPETAGILCSAIERFAGKIPLLGICLGHQAMAQVFGGKVVHAKELRHGKVSEITHDGRNLFDKLPQPLRVVRYHSLAVDEATLPSDFEVTARTKDNEVMGIRHKTLFLEGLQYHPESVMSAGGKTQLANFLRMIQAAKAAGAAE